MLSKCANPECPTTLLYLRSGKVFRIESDGPSIVNGRKPVRKVEHFWLCGPCSETWTVNYDRNDGVRIAPIMRFVRRAAAS